MADPRRMFRRNVQQVQADATRAATRLVNRLKGMTPQEFLRQPPSLFAKLTAAQYREIVTTIAPDVRLPAEPVIEEPRVEKRAMLDWWRERSAFARSFLEMLVVTVVCTLGGVLTPWAVGEIVSRGQLVRAITTENWPICQRLSRYTDGCVYFPSQDLDWAWVAEELGMPVGAVQRSNRHLPTQYIPRGAQLIVWRHRGRYMEQ